MLEKGASLGELALLYNQPRSASIKCMTNCFLWQINRKDFMEGVKKIVLDSAN
jgi:CRP-like cAMP-binding protein